MPLNLIPNVYMKNVSPFGSSIFQASIILTFQTTFCCISPDIFTINCHKTGDPEIFLSSECIWHLCLQLKFPPILTLSVFLNPDMDELLSQRKKGNSISLFIKWLIQGPLKWMECFHWLHKPLDQVPNNWPHLKLLYSCTKCISWCWNLDLCSLIIIPTWPHLVYRNNLITNQMICSHLRLRPDPQCRWRG